MITKIASGRNGQVVYYFDNGNNLSFIWHEYAYSDTQVVNGGLEATVIECMASGDDRLTGWLSNKYGDNPAGYIPVEDIPKIIAKADER